MTTSPVQGNGWVSNIGGLCAIGPALLPMIEQGIEWATESTWFASIIQNPGTSVGVALLAAGAAYAGTAAYAEYREMSGEYAEIALRKSEECDEIALNNLESITRPSDFEGVNIEKFRRSIEKVLARFKARDPERYVSLKHHYRGLVRMITEEQPNMDWGHTGSVADRPFHHQYHLESEGWDHGVRRAKAIVKGVFRNHILRDQAFDPVEREHKYRRAREREIREEFNFPRTPPESPKENED